MMDEKRRVMNHTGFELLPNGWNYSEYQGWRGHWCVAAIPSFRDFTDDGPKYAKMSMSKDHAWLYVLSKVKRVAS